MANILVVDDEVIIAESVREALRDVGHEVLTVRSAPEARSCLARERRSFAAVLTDIDLGPEGDGLDVAREAHALHPRIQVAYMTANHENLSRLDPCVLVFRKPFDPRDVAAQIDLLVG